MSADRLSSTGIVVLQSEEINTNVNSGNGTTRVYTGSRTAMLNQRAVELAFGAASTKLESIGDGNYKLTVGFTWDTVQGSNSEQPVNAHELEINMEAVDSWNTTVCWSQLVAAFGSDAGAAGARAFLYNQLRHWEGGLFSQDDLENQFTITYSGAQLALMLNLFRGVTVHGLKSGTQFNTVYRRRITAASYNQVQAAFTGAGMIWTTNELLAFENVPSSWWFQLPSTYLWKKTAPRVLTVAGQKTEISYEYIADLTFWSGTNVAYNSATLLTW